MACMYRVMLLVLGLACLAAAKPAQTKPAVHEAAAAQPPLLGADHATLLSIVHPVIAVKAEAVQSDEHGTDANRDVRSDNAFEDRSDGGLSAGSDAGSDAAPETMCDGSCGGGGGHSMKMYFHHSAHETILFKDWMTMSWGALFGSAVGIAVLAALYEGFKAMREVIAQRMMPRSPGKPEGCGNSFTLQEAPAASYTVPFLSSVHVTQSLLHIVQVFFSYCLMLVFMTYNIWLCLFLCLGSGVGYFIFCRGRVGSDQNDHCH